MTFGRGLLYVASAAGLALLLRTVLFGPLPVWVSALAFLLYLAIALGGVFIPRLQMYAPVLWRGPTQHGDIALTFDDGPHPEHTRKVLDILERAGVQATFFVVGRKVEAHPECLALIAARGHEVGIHSYQHDRWLSLRSPERIIDDLTRAQDAVERVIGQRPVLFRPPVGHISPRTETAASKLGLILVGWSARGYDGLRGAKPKKVAARIIRKLGPGAIVLLHDASENDDFEPASLAVLEQILGAVQARGLRPVALSQFASDWWDEDQGPQNSPPPSSA